MGDESGSAPLVELRDVRKSFGDNVVLDGIDLSIAREIRERRRSGTTVKPVRGSEDQLALAGAAG